MSLAKLLWHCHHRGFVLDDDHLGFQFKPRHDEEVVLLFRTDSSAFRSAFEHLGGKVCDAIVLLKKRDEAPRLAFIELKGGNVDDAIEQLRVATALVLPTIQPGVEMRSRVRAIVITDSPSPRASGRLPDGVPWQIVPTEARRKRSSSGAAKTPVIVDLRSQLGW